MFKKPEIPNDKEILSALNIPWDSRHFKYAKVQLAWARVGAQKALDECHRQNLEQFLPALEDVLRRNKFYQRDEALTILIDAVQAQLEEVQK